MLMIYTMVSGTYTGIKLYMVRDQMTRLREHEDEEKAICFV